MSVVLRLQLGAALVGVLVAATTAAQAQTGPASATAPSAAVASAPGPTASYARLPLRRESAQEDTTRANPTWWVLFALPLAIGLPWWLVKRRRLTGALGSTWGGQPAVPVPKRAFGTALTTQASVHVVRWAGHDYLIGCTPHTVTLLDKRPGPAGSEPHDPQPVDGGPA